MSCLFRDCPGDINEAVSTLIFAASWFGDLPELQTISKLFRERYGQKHTKASFEVYPGSLVNEEVGIVTLATSISSLIDYGSPPASFVFCGCYSALTLILMFLDMGKTLHKVHSRGSETKIVE